MTERTKVASRRNTDSSISDRQGAVSVVDSGPAGADPKNLESGMPQAEPKIRTTWARFLREGEPHIGVIQSIKKIYGCSWLNVFLLLTPVAWWSHFSRGLDHTLIFGLCFASIVPHECMFDYCAKQMALYLGQDFSDLMSITLNNAVEATLAIMLLMKCELKLLQSTITGVVLLHLLLVPGAAFLIGGARVWEQDLHPIRTDLNSALLTVGVLALLLPAAFYAAISGTSSTILSDGDLSQLGNKTQLDFLVMSRGLALMLLFIYIFSRVYYHSKNMINHPRALKKHREIDEQLQHQEPDVNQWACIVILLLNIGIMAVTSEWLVDSIQPMRTKAGITQEWFGLVLIPFVSFSADGTVAAAYHFHKLIPGTHPKADEIELSLNTLAKGEAIDMSIQFMLLWMPVVTLLGWWTNKPFNLLFDFFEVALLLGACFLVNFVTADNKTNWAEGFILLSFYIMIVLCTWFYTGQTSVSNLLLCTGQNSAAS